MLLILSVYILLFLLGAVVVTLTAALAVKEKTELARAYKMLSTVLLLYFLSEFFIYYQMGRTVGVVFMLTISLCNVCYYGSLYYWCCLLKAITGMERPGKKILLRLIAPYALIAEAIGIAGFKADHIPGIHQMAEGPLRTILIVWNLAFAVVMLLIASRYVLCGSKNLSRGESRAAVMGLGSVLLGYLCWTAWWDYKTAMGMYIHRDVIMDPLVYLYFAYCIITFWIFSKKDPLEIKDKKEISWKPKTVEHFCEKHGLTPREGEVLGLLLAGSSNREIGDKLFIAENTVKRHVYAIYRKTETQTRYEMMAKIGGNSKFSK